MASDARSEQASERIPIIVHGLPRTLFVPQGAWFVPKSAWPKHASWAFNIEPTSDTPVEVWIAARGLGAVQFARLESNEDVVCPMRKGFGVLKEYAWPMESLRVGACIPTEPFLFPDHKLDGHLLVLSADYESIEVPLTITRYSEPTSNVVVGLQWFLGIVIPAVLTGVFGFLIWKWQQSFTLKKNERDTFEDFKIKSHMELAQFFEVDYRLLRRRADAEFAQQLLSTLKYRDWLAPIPRKDRRCLMNALRAKNADQITEELAAIFWENEQLIRRSPH